MPAAWKIGSRNGGIWKLSMKKPGTPENEDCSVEGSDGVNADGAGAVLRPRAFRRGRLFAPRRLSPRRRFVALDSCADAASLRAARGWRPVACCGLRPAGSAPASRRRRRGVAAGRRRGCRGGSVGPGSARRGVSGGRRRWRSCEAVRRRGGAVVVRRFAREGAGGRGSASAPERGSSSVSESRSDGSSRVAQLPRR